MNISFLSTAHIHTRSFIENIKEADDGRRVVHVWDDNEDRGRRYAAEAGADFISDLNTVLTDDDVDGFIICAENTRHLPLLEKALPTNKPVFCEKPLVTSVADLEKTTQLLRASTSALFCGYFLPFSSAMQAAANVIQSGDLGTIRRVRFRLAHHAATGRWFDNPDLQWFTVPDLAGGGAFMDLGTHAVHLLRSLFGEVSEVWADIHNESGEYPDVDDAGTAHLRFKSGIRGTVEASWTQTGGIDGIEITGSEKSLWNSGENYVVGRPGEEPSVLPDSPQKPSRVDRLVSVIRGEVPESELQSDLAATIDSVAILAAAYESSRESGWVRVAAI